MLCRRRLQQLDESRLFGLSAMIGAREHLDPVLPQERLHTMERIRDGMPARYALNALSMIHTRA